MFGFPTMVKSLQWDDSYMMFTIPICETTFLYQRYPGLQSHPLILLLVRCGCTQHDLENLGGGFSEAVINSRSCRSQKLSKMNLCDRLEFIETCLEVVTYHIIEYLNN